MPTATATTEAPARVTGKQAMIQVLLDHQNKPLDAKTLFGSALLLCTGMEDAKTPLATLAAQAYTSSKKGGVFQKVGKGSFKLRDAKKARELLA